MPVPVEAGYCYLKVKFPPEFRLGATEYIYEGEGIMLPSSGNPALQVNEDFFIREQAYDRGNYIVFRGCNEGAKAGLLQVKVSGITTPEAVRDTSPFEFELYRDFDVSSYALTN